MRLSQGLLKKPWLPTEMNDVTNQLSSENIRSQITSINNRFDELDKKMEVDVFALKKINSYFKQIKNSYQAVSESKFFTEKNRETFAGNPIKYIRSNQYR